MSDKFTLLEGVEVSAVTAKAILIAHGTVNGTEEHWIPLSLVDLDNTDVEFTNGAVGDISVASWFLKQEGIDCD